ncbi:MAG: putative monovalent cation/H+ antiporter subunit A [Verrucomicrobiales bacterium]
MLFEVLAVFGLAALAPFLMRWLRGAAGWVFALLPLGLFARYLTMVSELPEQGVHTVAWDWAAMLGLELSFRADGLSLLFLLIISGIGAFILIYAGSYFHDLKKAERFYPCLLLFMGAMLGLCSADNLLVLFIFWELTSISSYLLISFDHQKKESRSAALQALIITGAGGLCLLAGIVLLQITTGITSVSELISGEIDVREHSAYLPVLILFLLGAFTKSAQVPFHFWLPGAMAAPTPVSAYLHSATMVKAGVFLLARIHPGLSGTEVWTVVVTGFGALTMLTGAILAWPQTDLKRLLAYTTVASLGICVMLLGIGTELALKAALVFLLGHALYKGALFMVAGSLDHETGSRDVRDLSGLFKLMPFTGLAAMLSALSMSGIPPLLGFLGKEVVYDAQVASPENTAWLVWLALTANALMISVAITVGIRPFFGKQLNTPKKPHEAPWGMCAGPVVLAILSLAFGAFPQESIGHLMTYAVSATLGAEYVITLKLWHGFNFVLALSGITLAVGLLLFFLRHHGRMVRTHTGPLVMWGPEAIYERSMSGLIGFAKWQTRLLQNGYLRNYLLILIAACIFFPLLAIAISDLGFVLTYELPIQWEMVVLSALMMVAAMIVALARSRLTAVAAMGVVGFGVAGIFAYYGAPDLAITQVLVETLSLLLFIIILYHLPKFAVFSRPRTRIHDAALATGFGALMTLLVLRAVDNHPRPAVSEWYMENVAAGYGKNLVNVILVDFRALDTLGEVTVLGIAGIGVYALLKLRPLRSSEAKPVDGELKMGDTHAAIKDLDQKKGVL